MARGGGLTPAFFPLGGGLDLVTPAISMPPGFAIAALNYESNPAGYKRILGYERFDGHVSPSEAPYHMLNFDAGVGAIVAGNTVTGLTSGATGIALSNATVLTGSYGGSDATGYIGLGAVTGTFQNNEALRVGGVTKATANGLAVAGLSPDTPTQLAWEATAQANALALISAVPGSGPVRGVKTYKGDRYAFRDNAGATACIMFKATAAGWVIVPQGRSIDFTSGGTYEIAEGDTITGATSGATAIVRRLVGASGAIDPADWAAGTAEGLMVLYSQTGTFQAENLNVGANMNVATIAGNSALNAFPPGGRYEFVNHNFYASSGLQRMYGVNGVGRAFEFDGTAIVPITTGTPGEAPHRIAEFQMHLFLAFPGGNIVFSQPGEPLGYDASLGAGAAGTFGIGDEITDFISNSTSVLTILGANGVFNITGHDADDFTMEPLTGEAGALPWTAEKVGTAIYMDNRGVRSMVSTQAYGNFQLGTLTVQVTPLLNDYRTHGVQPVASCRIRTKDQYRVFFDNNQGLIIYLGKKHPEVMPIDFGKLITCICSDEGDDLREETFFGSDDGFVYQMERGYSFDGDPIPHFIRLPFGHQGAPQNRKRYFKVVIECAAAPNTTLKVSSDFDYGGAGVVPTPSQQFAIAGGGGIWNVSNWNTFYWSAPLYGKAEAFINGVGQNLSLLIAGNTSNEPPHLIQGVTLYYSMRGLVR